MTNADLQRIEDVLNVKLPAKYRDLVLNYPIRADEGTSDSILYDDADAIIKFNTMYRDGFAGLPPWPPHIFFIGDDGAACPYVIDLRDERVLVTQLDHGHPDKVLEKHGDIRSWMESFITRSGIDPDAPPQPPLGCKKIALCALAVLIGASVAGLLLGKLLTR